MKRLIFLALGFLITLGSSFCYASSTCILTWQSGGYSQQPGPTNGKGIEFISCNKGNPDSDTVVEPDGNNDIPTVLNSLLAKHYKISSQTTSSYTLTK